MSVIGDMYQGNGAKPISWEEVGQTIEGEIENIRSKQLTKFGTEIPETWDDGSPKQTPILTVITAARDDEDDDGRRDVYLRSNAYTAFGKALREAFRSKPEDSDIIGCTIKLQFFSTEKSGKGQPRKLFRCRITRKSATADAWDADSPQGGGTPVGAPVRSAAPAKTGKPAGMPPGGGGEPDDSIPF
jgi:hypothetical protein